MKPGGRGSGARRAATENREEPTPAETRASMTWAQRLQRIFGIDIEKGGLDRDSLLAQLREQVAATMAHGT